MRRCQPSTCACWSRALRIVVRVGRKPTSRAISTCLLTLAPLDLGDEDLQHIVLESPAGQRRRIDVEAGLTVVGRRRRFDAEVVGVPVGERVGVAGAEEQAPMPVTRSMGSLGSQIAILCATLTLGRTVAS